MKSLTFQTVGNLDALEDDVHLGADVAHHLVHRLLRLLLEVLLHIEVPDYRGEDSTGSAHTLLPAGGLKVLIRSGVINILPKLSH